MNGQTIWLGLPFLAATRAKKHVMVSAALTRLDGLLACRVQSRQTSAHTAAAAEGDACIAPAAGSSGDWSAAQAGDLLRWVDGVWSIEAAPVGLVVTRSRSATRTRSWVSLCERPGNAQALTLLGIGTEADAAIRAAPSSTPCSSPQRPPMEGGDGDLRLTLSKEASADVLSLLLRTEDAARAEIGLVGDDRLRLRVSADGSSFTDALLFENDGWIGVGAPAGSARLAIGGAPPTTAAVSAIGPARWVSFPVSDKFHSSLYVRNELCGAIVGTD